MGNSSGLMVNRPKERTRRRKNEIVCCRLSSTPSRKPKVTIKEYKPIKEQLEHIENVRAGENENATGEFASSDTRPPLPASRRASDISSSFMETISLTSRRYSLLQYGAFRKRAVSMEMVAQVVDQSTPHEEELYVEKDMPDSAKLKALVRASWKEIRAKSAYVIEQYTSTYMKNYVNEPSTKAIYTFLEENEESRILIEKACSMEHVHHIMNTVDLAMSHLDDTGRLSKVLRKLGARHASHGINVNDHFECFMDALCYAMKEMTSPEYQCNPDAMRAWNLLCDLICFHIQVGSRRMSYYRPMLEEGNRRSSVLGSKYSGASLS